MQNLSFLVLIKSYPDGTRTCRQQCMKSTEYTRCSDDDEENEDVEDDDEQRQWQPVVSRGQSDN